MLIMTAFNRCADLARQWRDTNRAGDDTAELDVQIEQALVDAGFEVIKTDPVEYVIHFEGDSMDHLFVELESGFTILIPT